MGSLYMYILYILFIFLIDIWLVVEPAPLKNLISSAGIPNIWNIKFMFRTTNQVWFLVNVGFMNIKITINDLE